MFEALDISGIAHTRPAIARPGIALIEPKDEKKSDAARSFMLLRYP